MARYLMTHSLLSSWLYAMKDNPYENETTNRDPFEEFMQTLRRESTPTAESKQKGIDFEDLVTRLVNGEVNSVSKAESADGQQRILDASPLSEHKWYQAASKVAGVVRGGQLQYRARKVITVSGITVLLYGRLDALKAGVVYDVKFSGNYEVGKYFSSTQHPTYLALVPEAREFTYLVSNGTAVWRETYRRDETADICPIIADFFDWLRAYDLMNLYKQMWSAL